MKYVPWLMILLMAAFVIVEATQWQTQRSAEKAELKAIKQEKEVLAHLLKNSHRQQARLADSIYNRVEDNKRLSRLNEASNERLKQWKQRSKYYEKALSDILTYTDDAMDSLYRTRYPQPDTIRELRTAPGVD